MTELDQGEWRFVEGGQLVPDAVVSAVGYTSLLDQPALHRGLPSPALTLVLTFDEPVISGFERSGQDADSTHLVLGGLHTRPAYITQPRVQSGIQLAVRPLALRRLFGVPAGELREQAVDAREVLGSGAEDLRQRLAELTSWPERFAALATYLRANAAEASPEPRPEVVEAWKWIAWHRGTGSMSALARHVHLGERQLNSVFKAELGISPKAASRLMRFEHARQRIARAVRERTPLDLAAVAHSCGYYDHSHLVRDFQQYAGCSPSRWIGHELRNIQAGAGQPAEEFAV
ncbi:AraC family transcriptional regulator [Saccharopolyspora mangrovi]|uniref:Helix-turn-helix domain-containing protein n=1 Tax=Saccharopolyspora mangrovi TaxID=3082379 RepID=A0ABU6ALA2_9PSEU|nr:helix-turn-helix domain-containing protein [Saccharopolyspora sp. S2-29]MEB3372179.1 helix-turn-helix domain-containing protein [Saccharopolyspora sp. S2-29]